MIYNERMPGVRWQRAETGRDSFKQALFLLSNLRFVIERSQTQALQWDELVNVIE
jgi:hypothetical protein